MARQVFSAYRRDEFADPDMFLLQLGTVLERYSDGVIRYVCDPITGIQRRCKSPPSIAHVVEACEAEATSIATRERYAAIPRPNFKALPPPPRVLKPGHRANTLVPPTAPQYRAMCERAQRSDADPLDYRWDGANLWVNLNWLHDTKPAKRDPFADVMAKVRPPEPQAEAAE